MNEATENLDDLLVSVIKGNREKVVGWINEEPGSWGFLAGRAVLVCKERKGEPLTDSERRVVWHRMWELLTLLKNQTNT